ncbi:MAG: SPFH domain-containing protein [Firmicutes bacterium]|nr:SPFH domain-containing protein [Bacillota bacterium]
MLFFVLGLIVFLGAILIFGFKKERVVSGERARTVLRWKFRPAQLVSLAGLLIIGMGCITSVPTGHTGVVTTFGNVEDYTYEAGIHFKSPFQNVTNMDNRTQKQVMDLTAFSSDIQEVSVSFSLNYQISKENAQTIYRTIGVSYYDTVIAPRIQEAVKTVFAQYTAENLITKRSSLSAEITDILTANLTDYNIIVLAAAVENIDFSDAFTDAVEAKQVAEQAKLKAQIEQQQANLEAQAAAERSIIAANAAAEVSKIEAEAARYAGEKEAEKNRKLSETLTPELIEYYYTQVWNGELPEFVSGADSSTLPILNFDDSNG